MPTFVKTLDPDGRRPHWRTQGATHGFLHDLTIDQAVGPSALPAHVPEGVLQTLDGAHLLPATMTKARKLLGLWATSRQFYATVLAAGRAALLLEDDAILTPHFCESTSRALKALPATWDLLLLGHCAESYRHIRSCSMVAPHHPSDTPMFLTLGAYPMCTHAYVLSERGAGRLHALLAEWPDAYTKEVLRTAKAGWETNGTAKRLRPTKRPVDDAHDVAIAKLVAARQVEAYLVWPQTAVQWWMLDSHLVNTTGRKSDVKLARHTSDLIDPPICRTQRAGLSRRRK